jgi:hypothetical protein
VNGVPGEKDEIYQENVLQVLQYVLRPLGRGESMVKSTDVPSPATDAVLLVEDLYKLYSRAWEIKPDNLDLGVNVFMTGGVRLKDWEVVKRVRIVCGPSVWSTSLKLSLPVFRTDCSSTVKSQPGSKASFLGRLCSVPTGKSARRTDLDERADLLELRR